MLDVTLFRQRGEGADYEEASTFSEHLGNSDEVQ